MKVEVVTKYKFKGKEYSSLKEIKENIHNTIGVEVLDKIQRTCPLSKHKDYIKLLELICSKEVRAVLIDCFNVEHTEHWTSGEYNDYDEYETVNVLDID